VSRQVNWTEDDVMACSAYKGAHENTAEREGVFSDRGHPGTFGNLPGVAAYAVVSCAIEM